MQRFGLGLGLGRGCLTIIGGGAPGNGDGEEGPANILLITDDTTHGAATNTKAAMEAGGHTVTFATTASIDGTFDFSPYDVIALCRVSPGASALVHVRAAMDAGKPCLVGSSAGVTTTTNQTGISTDLDLTGPIRATDDVNGTDSEDIEDNSHEITSGFALGRQVLFEGNNWTMVLDDTISYVGVLLADCTGSNTAMNGRPTLTAIEAGTSDMEGVALAARAVVWQNLYAGQNDYNADGEALVDACLQWLLS